MLRATLFSLLTIMISWSAQASAQPTIEPASRGLSAPEIVANMTSMNQKRAATLKGFTSERTYELEYNGFPSHKHATMVVEADFTAPSDKQLKIVSEQGSELLQKRVLHKLVETELEASARNSQAATALSEINYEFSLRGREQKDGRDCYVLDVKPRSKSKFLYEGTVWVDAAEFAVVHILARPAKNPSFWTTRVDIEHRYEKVGDFWLPASNRSASSTRFGGHAVLAIEYGTYKLKVDTASLRQQNLSNCRSPRMTTPAETGAEEQMTALMRAMP